MKHLLPVLALLSACTASPSPAPLEGSGETLDYETFVARSIRALCADFFDCCSPMDRSALGVDMWSDYDACVAGYEAVLDEHSAMPMIASGALLFDGTAAASCIAELESATCLESAELRNRFTEHPCADVARGTAPLGADCSDGMAVACESGFCEGGVCAELPTLGEPCFVTCTEGVCVVDEVCGAPALEGDPCMRDMQCEFGLACRGASYEGGMPHPGACAPVTLCLGT